MFMFSKKKFVLWAKILWVKFALAKILVGRVPGFISVVWGYNFACKIKIF